PQIVLSVYHGINLQGYGRAHVPIQAGVHKFNVSLLTPIPSSLLGKFGTIFGYQPELLQPSMLATTAGNNQELTGPPHTPTLEISSRNLVGLIV
ncbi:hypothetical protein RN001_013214, partial [Aquatica leii]